MSDPETRSRLQIPVFEAGQRGWTIGDVMTLAPRMPAQSNPPLPATAVPAAGNDDALEAALRAFRYRHELISAQDCTDWLACRELVYADLRASMRRRLTGAQAVNAAERTIDFMLADDFARLTRALAARLATMLDLGLLPEGDIATHWPKIDESWQQRVATVVNDATREHLIEQDRLAWLQVECELVEFDHADAAHEARLCVLEDGQSLVDVASESGFAHHRGCWFVSALPPAWSHAVLQLRPGAVTPPVVDGERHLVIGLTRFIEPALDDSSVCAAVDAQLLDQHERALLARHVRWTLPGMH